jgi:hypothetical protein
MAELSLMRLRRFSWIEAEILIGRGISEELAEPDSELRFMLLRCSWIKSEILILIRRGISEGMSSSPSLPLEVFI